MLAVEQDLLDRATTTIGTRMGQVGRIRIERATDGRGLSPEQRQVVEELCGRGDGISVVRAAAGTGKTYVLDAARAAWEAAGLEVVGCALSARAALELTEQAGIPAVTIAQLNERLARGVELEYRSVLIVDEAGMVGTRDLAALAAAAARSHAKLVLVGDDRQLPEIQAGGAFRALAERLPASQLHEVRRQTHGWDRQALDELRSGEVERWARAYRDHGRITVADSPAAARAALVNDWYRGTGDRLMIAARREDVADLNHRARQLLQAEGARGPDELRIEGRGYAAGDRVVGARNDRRAGILNGQRGTVTTTDTRNGALQVRLDSGSSIRLETDYLAAGHLEHAYAITAHRAQGATVDESYVLGGEELHREWGYTALSRHRSTARFYIARGDLRLNPELPPPRAPLVAGITNLLERTQAKDLALDSLPLIERQQLEQQRAALRARLDGTLPPRRLRHVEVDQVNADASALKSSQRIEGVIRAQLAALGRFDRRERKEIEVRLEQIVETGTAATKRLAGSLERVEGGDRAEATWTATHGTPAQQLAAIDNELRTRTAGERTAAQRLEALERRSPSLALENTNDHVTHDREL